MTPASRDRAPEVYAAQPGRRAPDRARMGRAAVLAVVLAVVAAPLLVGCGGPLAEGVAEYDRARYPEALVALREAEPAGLRAATRTRVRYALYRGLTHFALGDLPAAHGWLARAHAACLADPALLDAEESGRLASAWAHLGAR
jgi:hypothetical protein